MLSICIQLVHTHWAYTYKLYKHTHTICTCKISIHIQIVCVCSAFANKMYAYAQHTLTKKKNWNHMDHALMLSICVQIVLLCWAFANKLYLFAEHTLTNCLPLLSILISAKHTEHTLTLFWLKKSPHFFEQTEFLKSFLIHKVKTRWAYSYTLLIEKAPTCLGKC